MGETALRIIDIPPYQRAGVNYDPAERHFMMKDLIASLKAKGQLDGVEPGFFRLTHGLRNSGRLPGALGLVVSAE